MWIFNIVIEKWFFGRNMSTNDADMISLSNALSNLNAPSSAAEFRRDTSLLFYPRVCRRVDPYSGLFVRRNRLDLDLGSSMKRRSLVRYLTLADILDISTFRRARLKRSWGGSTVLHQCADKVSIKYQFEGGIPVSWTQAILIP